jgi:hypothetical protein
MVVPEEGKIWPATRRIEASPSGSDGAVDGRRRNRTNPSRRTSTEADLTPLRHRSRTGLRAHDVDFVFCAPERGRCRLHRPTGDPPPRRREKSPFRGRVETEREVSGVWRGWLLPREAVEGASTVNPCIWCEREKCRDEGERIARAAVGGRGAL